MTFDKWWNKYKNSQECRDNSILGDIEAAWNAALENQWKKVEDELPNNGEHVIRGGKRPFTTKNEDHFDIGQLVDEEGRRWADWGVDYWMSIPKLPKEDK
jgi:hypothetical protein